MMDVVVDTDILSTLSKVGKTALLQQLFPKSKIILCPSVQSEISRAVKLGILDSEPANFSQVELTQSEKNVAKEMGGRTSLGGADIECLTVSKIGIVCSSATISRWETKQSLFELSG